MDGNYGLVRDTVWPRATHLIWLDYERSVIMRRVIVRSLWRVMTRTELWAGNRERWRQLLRPSHPIRWAWRTWERRRREMAETLVRDEYRSVTVFRLRHPSEAAEVVDRLAALAARRRPD